MISFGAEANEAFDLAQGVFLNFYRRRLQTFAPQQAFLAYLRQAAYHLWIAFVRRRRPDLSAKLDAGPAPGCVEDEFFRRELQERLETALSRLPDRERQIMQLTLDGQKPADIAPLLGLTKVRVFRLLWQARNRLAEDLQIDRPPTTRGRKPRPKSDDPEPPQP
jgi:RNA polymerase sigma factor (sigma-70 family)